MTEKGPNCGLLIGKACACEMKVMGQTLKKHRYDLKTFELIHCLVTGLQKLISLPMRQSEMKKKKSLNGREDGMKEGMRDGRGQ